VRGAALTLGRFALAPGCFNVSPDQAVDAGVDVAVDEHVAVGRLTQRSAAATSRARRALRA
jgi:hypothetical protein